MGQEGFPEIRGESMSANDMNRERVQRAFVAILFITISALFIWMTWGLLLPVFMAAILAGLTYPVYTQFAQAFHGRSSVAAGVTLIGVILLVVVPLILLAGMVAGQALSIAESVTPWVDEQLSQTTESGPSLEWIPFWERLEPFRDQVTQKLGEFVAAASSFLVRNLAAATRGAVGFLFDVFIMLYSTFFFLRFGRELLDEVMRLVPLAKDDKSLLLGKFVSVSRATLKGTLVIGIVQGGLAGLAFAAVGIDNAVFWAAIMAVLSVIPGIGTALVWVPAVIFLMADGQTVSAVGLLLWCGIVVGLADNLLRPALVGKDTEMPDLIVMLSTFGGLMVFGAAGLVIGPLIAALFLAIWRIHGETFGDLLAEPKPTAEG